MENSLSRINQKFQTDMAVIGLDSALTESILAWASSSSDSTSSRLKDLVNDKTRVLGDFFAFAGKRPDQIKPADVQAYRIDLERRNLAPATIYASISRISAFYEWMMTSPDLSAFIKSNPTNLVRPKAPKAYQSKSVKSFSDDEISALLNHVKQLADTGDIVAKRDYAMLLIYILTGMRREEVVSLTWENVALGTIVTLTGRVKGGESVTREIKEPSVKTALLDYLKSSGRFATLQPESPLWTRHDRSGKPGEPLTSHAFVKNFKKYAMEIGINHVHLHQTRHTFARIIADETGSWVAAQDGLGHKNGETTRVYVQKLGTKKDNYSVTVANRLKLITDSPDQEISS